MKCRQFRSQVSWNTRKMFGKISRNFANVKFRGHPRMNAQSPWGTLNSSVMQEQKENQSVIAAEIVLCLMYSTFSEACNPERLYRQSQQLYKLYRQLYNPRSVLLRKIFTYTQNNWTPPWAYSKREVVQTVRNYYVACTVCDPSDDQWILETVVAVCWKPGGAYNLKWSTLSIVPGVLEVCHHKEL